MWRRQSKVQDTFQMFASTGTAVMKSSRNKRLSVILLCHSCAMARSFSFSSSVHKNTDSRRRYEHLAANWTVAKRGYSTVDFGNPSGVIQWTNYLPIEILYLVPKDIIQQYFFFFCSLWKLYETTTMFSSIYEDKLLNFVLRWERGSICITSCELQGVSNGLGAMREDK